MSREIHIDSVPIEERKKIMKELQIKIESSEYVFNSQPKYIYPFDVTDTHAYLPFAYAEKFDRPPREYFPVTNTKFIGKLRPTQREVKKEVINNLNKYGSTLLASYTGFGKTITAIYVSTKIKMKTLIVIHRIVLIKQWKNAIKTFCPESKVQILTAKSEFDDSADFYIMNPINIPKHPRSFYKNIGFLILDEVHLIMSEILSKCMHMIIPRYLLGLSATPYREDGLNILLELFFGKRKIHRQLRRKHTVYKLKSGFTPEVERAKNGRVNWGAILEAQATSVDRNEMIINIIKFFPKRVFLVLVKRISQGEYLVKRLNEEKEDVTSLLGKQQEFEQKSRILVGTTGKCSTGFDHPRLNGLILASDIQAFFIQTLGRVMRTEEVEPIVIDIVDKNYILEKHYKVRHAVYLECGGTIKDFHSEFPKFSENV